MKLYIASLLITLSSCTYEFSIDDIEAKRKPVVFCMPNTLSDTTLIQVSQSTTVNNKGTNTSDKPDITFKLNGVEKEIKYIDKATDLLPANSYYVLSLPIGQVGNGFRKRFIRQRNTVPHIIY